MTRQTFYRAFRKAVAKRWISNWTANDRGYIRYEDKSTQTGRCDCPIVFLYYVRTGNHFNSRDYEKAAKAMGLNERDADTIANGADDYRSTKDKTGTKKARAARKALLRAIGQIGI